MSDATLLAANDNQPDYADNCNDALSYYGEWADDSEWDEDYDDKTITEIAWLCSTRPTHVRFNPADAVTIGFETNVISIDYLDYLMGNLVADEDWDASQALKRRYGDI